VVVFKKKRRKGYSKKTGHRQPFTTLKIKEIQLQ
jgi:large subunit ribosomal protein L21